MEQMAFVGFASAAEWLKALDPEQPVNVDVITRPVPTSLTGLTSAEMQLVLSQVQGSEVVFLLSVIGRYELIGGEVFPPDRREGLVVRKESALFCAQAWGIQQGLRCRHAFVSWPRNLLQREGEAEFMRYVEADDRFVLEPGQPAEGV